MTITGDGAFTAWRVYVETASIDATTKTRDGRYVDCNAGMITVVTNDPATILKTFHVMTMERIGPGYVLEGE